MHRVMWTGATAPRQEVEGSGARGELLAGAEGASCSVLETDGQA